MHARIRLLSQRLEEAGLEGLLVTSPPNVRYLSGFTGSSGALLATPGATRLYTDSRYTLQAAQEAPEVEVVTVPGQPAAEAVASAGGIRLGFEAGHVTVAQHRHLVERLARGGELVAAWGHVEALRTVKDPEEIRAIEASLEVTSRAFQESLRHVRPGTPELRIAAVVEGAMREAGATGPAFESIVASGPRGALPHARATGRSLERGEPVVMDIGAMVDGYASDMTRTLFVGEVPERGRRIHRAVEGAVEAARAQVREGVPAARVDGAARKALSDAGFEEHAYGHGTGHGVGLQVHEEPRISRGREERLREGMVLTIEPGIYIPGWGGVRIEEMVVVEKGGCRLLTATPRELMAV